MSVDLLPHSFFVLPDGARLRYAVLDAEGVAQKILLVLPGRREFIEKKARELEPLRLLGYRLVILELRGQGLSSRFLSGAARQRDHIDDFALYLEDLRCFFDATLRPSLSLPLLVHGHSLGGHVALRWLIEDAPPISGAFLTAPMLALSTTFTHLAAYGLAWASVHLFHKGREYAPFQHDFDSRNTVFSDNQFTHEEARFRVMEQYFTAHSDLIVGGVDWSWLLAALHSMQITHHSSYLARLACPVLVLTGGQDPVTPAKEIEPILDALPGLSCHRIEAARHDILNEADPMREEAWHHFRAWEQSGNI